MTKKILILLLFIIPLYSYYLLSRPVSIETEFSSPDKMARVIKFSSSMCLDCKKINDVFDEVHPKYSGKVFLVSVNIQNTDTKTKNMIKKYNVNIVPTTIFIDENSFELRRVEGFINSKQLGKYFEELINE